SQDSTYSANYSGTSVEERSGYTSNGSGVSGSIEFHPLGGGAIVGESAAEKLWNVLFDFKGWYHFIRGEREDGRGGWEKYASPAESFRRDHEKMTLGLSPVPTDLIGSIYEGDAVGAMKAAAKQLAYGAVFKYGGKVWKKLANGKFKLL